MYPRCRGRASSSRPIVIARSWDFFVLPGLHMLALFPLEKSRVYTPFNLWISYDKLISFEVSMCSGQSSRNQAKPQKNFSKVFL